MSHLNKILEAGSMIGETMEKRCLLNSEQLQEAMEDPGKLEELRTNTGLSAEDLRSLAERYPQGASFRIVDNPGSQAGTEYVFGLQDVVEKAGKDTVALGFDNTGAMIVFDTNTKIDSILSHYDISGGKEYLHAKESKVQEESRTLEAKFQTLEQLDFSDLEQVLQWLNDLAQMPGTLSSQQRTVILDAFAGHGMTPDGSSEYDPQSSEKIRKWVISDMLDDMKAGRAFGMNAGAVRDLAKLQ